MNFVRIIGVISLVCVLSVGAARAADGAMTELDKALAAVATWKSGDNSGPLKTVESTVMAVAKDPKQRDAVEQRLIRTLGSAASIEGRSFICRQLRTIGTGRSVAALEALLTDADLSHMARYALGRLEDPAAGAALHRALGKTEGSLKAGIINTLASRRYAKALGDITPLVASSDKTVAWSAVEALAWFGTPEAAAALESARRTAKGEQLLQINGALLKCAARLVADGRKADAARIYRTFYSPKQPRHIRLGALRGLAVALGAEAAPLITDAIKSDDPQLRASAIRFMTMVTGEDATKAFVAMLPSLPPDSQVLVIRSLAIRGEASAAPVITKATTSEHAAVRVAAIEALGAVGDVTSVALLSRTAAASGAEQQAARASLQQLSGKDVDAALLRAISTGETNVRLEVIRALVARRTTDAFAQLLKTTGDDDAAVRRAAIGAVGSLGGAKDLPALLALMIKPKEPGDHGAVEQAVGTAFLAVSDLDVRAQAVLGALAGAPAEAKPTLIRLLGRAATPQALAAVRTAMKDANPDVRNAAIRTLAAWPDASPAEELLALAKSSTDLTHKVLFLRGYVRMAGMSSDPTKMYLRAMDLAKRPEDKRMVLAGLGSSSSAEALRVARQYLADPQLKAEAALAAVEIAGRLRNLDGAYAKASLQNILAVVKDADIRKKAIEILNDLDKFEGYILVWNTVGPYKVKGKGGGELFDIALGPEKPDAKDVKWTRLNKGIDAWGINIENMFGSMDHCAAYVRTSIWSPVDQAVRLEMGSDDAIKVWLNGKKIHGHNGSRGMTARDDIVDTRLAKGWNVLMMKIIDFEGGWAFCCRIRNAEGGPIAGLKAQAK